MRIEGEGGRYRAIPFGQLHHLFNDSAVPEVDAIEYADAEHQPPPFPLQSRRAARHAEM